MKKFLFKNKWIIGLIAVLLVAAVAVAVILGTPGEDTPSPTEPPTEPTVTLELPVSEYDVYCVLTESAIRYGADGKSYEIDTWSLDQNQGMALTIDMNGIVPREGRVYRVYVPKAGGAAVFAVPEISGGMQKADFQRMPIAYRDANWLYNGGMTMKMKITDESVIYYLEVVDDKLRRTEATTVTSLAKFNGECSMDETHSHTNGCYLYNAYLHYGGGFLDPHVVDWAALSVDGSGIYGYIGTANDTLYACLPGEDATLADVVFTTSDVKKDGTIDVQDLTGREYTCKISAQGVQPVGGRSYRVDAAEDGTTVFSAPDRTNDGYDLKNAPVVDIQDSTVTLSVGKDWNIGDTTRILTARRFWTGWTYLEEVEGNISDISLANRVGSCTDDEDHIHTNNCFYYNAYYKTDGEDTLRWIMTEETGKTLNAALGAADVLPWGSCDPANTVLVTSVYDGKVSVMDMNGAWKTYPYEAAEDLPVYSGALYHAELDNGKLILSGANTSFTQPGFDVTRQPLRSIQGNTLVFSQGENEKVTYLTEETKIYYMAIGDNRLIPMSSGQLQTAQRTGSCQEKGDHICDNNCFYSNAIFGCDGQGNLKWLIMSAYNGSIYSSIGSSGNLKSGYADPAQMCLTLSAMDKQGKIEVLQMDGTKAVYTVDTTGLPPEKGRLYACTVSGGVITFAEPNDDVKNCVRGGIVGFDGNLVTMQNRESFFITEATRIVNAEVRNDKLYLVEGEALGLCQPTNYCKAAGEGHDHIWSKCYNSNAAYATDGAGNLLWMVVLPDGASLSSFMGNQKGVSAQAGDPAKVLLTTSHIDLRDDGTMWISGITMDGTKVSYPLTGDSLIPVKGSMYHMELVDGKAKLSAPNKNHREVGYDLGARPLAHLEGDMISLANGEQYHLTEDTRIYNVDIVGSDMVLTGTNTLTEAKLNCTEEHTHVNDCYSYNMFFAADSNDDLLWVVNAPADTGIFYRSGVDAETAYAADEAANVVVTTSHTYPSWENGTKVNKVFVVDMTTGTETEVTVNENSLIPAQGKGYCMAIQPDGTALFSIAQTVEVPNSAGYDFARYQIVDVSADGKTVLLRNGRLLRVTEDTQILNTEVGSGDRLTNITAGGTVLPSATRDNCTGAEHNHTYECFYYNAWYASDADGNIRWILTGATDTTSLYNAQAKETDRDLSPLTGAAGFVIATSPVRGGKVSAEDVFGTKYENVTLADSETLIPMDGYLYSLAVNGDGSVSFATPTGKGVWRAQITDYTDGVISIKGFEKTFKVCANTLIRYVDRTADGKVRFAEGSGILTSQAQSAWFVEYNGSLKWLVMEVDGEAIYKNANDTAGVALTAAPETIVLTTGYAYPEWVDGVKQTKVPVTDMTGKESILTLADSSAEAIPGKLYQVSLNSDGTAVLDKCQSVTRRAKLTAKDETAETLTLTDGSGAQTLALAKNVWAYTVTSDSTTRRITLDAEGISETTNNYNAIYGVNEANEVAWILTEKNCNGIWYALYGVDAKYDAPDVPALAGDTGVVFVTASDYAAKTVSFQDVSGSVYTDYAVDFPSGSNCWPVANYAYKAAIDTADQTVAFTELVDGTSASADLKRNKTSAYAAGVLTCEVSGYAPRTYKITDNTHIAYITKAADGTVRFTDGAGFPETDAFNAYVKADSNGFAQWVVVETGGNPIYYNLGTYTPVTSEPEKIVLTLGEPYPEWTAEGVKSIKVKTVDMTGAEAELTVAGAEYPVAGRLYAIAGDGGAYTFTHVQKGTDVINARLVESGSGSIKVNDGKTATYSFTENAKKYLVNRSGSADSGYRIALNGEGLGNASDSNLNLLFGLNEYGEISWILSHESLTLSFIANEDTVPAAAVAVPTFETVPVALVTNVAANADGTYTAQMTDIYGGTHSCTVDTATTVWPKAGLMYSVSVSGDTAKFETLQGKASSDRTVSYADGVLSGKTQTYQITANTHIFYVKKDASGNVVAETTYAAGGFPALGTGEAQNCLFGSGLNTVSDGGYAQWIIVGVDDVSLYSLRQTWPEAVLRPTTAPEDLAVITSDITVQDGKFYVTAMDMTGEERTLRIDTDSQLLPAKGKLYVISGEDSVGYTFQWGTVAQPSEATFSTDTDMYRRNLKSVDAGNNRVTIENQTYTLAQDAVLISTERENSYLAKNLSVTTMDGLKASDSQNTYFGLNGTGEIAWILNCTQNSIYYIADESLADSGKVDPQLPPVTAAPKDVVLTVGEPYPEWVDGTKVIKVSVTDMTGTARTLTLSADSLIPVSGKLYAVKSSNGDADAVLDYCNDTYVKSAVLTGNTDGTLALTDDDGTVSLALAENAYQSIAEITDSRMALGEKTIGVVGTSTHNALYGASEDGITWVLTTSDAADITGGLGKAGDAPLMAAPTFETAPIVLVTTTPYLSGGYFVIDMQDIHGNTYTGFRFDNTASVYPKAGQLYTATFSGNTVTLSQLTTSSVDRISIESYENGVINEKNGRDYTHKVTVNTNICYVDYADNKFTFAQTDAGFKLNAYSCYIPPVQSSGNYLPWIIVEVDNESIYGKIDEDDYSVTYRNTTDPAKLVLVTSEITLDGENCVVTAVDMTGNERTLICDTTKTAPVKGKLYEITTVDGKTSFAYPDTVASYNGEDLLKTGTTDVIRGTITGFTGTSSFTLSQQSKSFSMGENGVFIPVKRIGSAQIVEQAPGATPAVSSSMNAMFGVDANGELAWIMIETGGKSIWQVAVDTDLTAAWPTAQ